MKSYTQLLYQIVFPTRHRAPVLIKENREALFQYIAGILENKKCHLYRINGVEDHIHILTHVHPTIALSPLIKDIKVASSGYIKSKRLFPHFEGWVEGFGAFTYSIKAKDTLIEYVKNQERHHRKETFIEEYTRLLQEHEVEYEEKYLN